MDFATVKGSLKLCDCESGCFSGFLRVLCAFELTKSDSFDRECQILLFCDREWTPILYGLSEVIDTFIYIQVHVIQVRVYGCQVHHFFSVPISVHIGSLAFFHTFLQKYTK